MEIFLPNVLNENSVFNVINDLWMYREEDCYINVSNLTFVRPFGALVLATELAHLYDKTRNPVKISGVSNYKNAHSYLAHVGFFKAAYFDIGKNVGSAKGNSRYIPIRKLNEMDFATKRDDGKMNLVLKSPFNFLSKRKQKIYL